MGWEETKVGWHDDDDDDDDVAWMRLCGISMEEKSRILRIGWKGV